MHYFWMDIKSVLILLSGLFIHCECTHFPGLIRFGISGGQTMMEIQNLDRLNKREYG